ncbi:MAG: PAS domain S-box protein [Gallionella sp.]
MPTLQKQSYLLKSPVLIFFIVALSVFMSETSVRLLLNYLPDHPLYERAIIDASLLVVLLSPILYFFLFRPLLIHIRGREKIKEVLHQNEEEEFKVMVNTAVDGIITISEHGLIERFNPAAERIFGYTETEVVNKNISMLMPSPYREAHDGYLAHYIHTDEKKVIGIGREVQGQRKNGTVFSMDLAVGEMHRGKRRSFTGTVRDISDRKQVEAQQGRLMQEIESANEELKNFAYVVSHDLKAPLRAISSLANWISTDYTDKFDEEGRAHMQLLISRVHRMDSLIDGILLYSRVGQVKETMVAVDLGQLVPEVIDSLAPPAGITIIIENSLPTLMTEPTRIQQVFQNLLSNAIKYMGKPEGEIRIACRKEGKKWQFSVSDNGVGIKQPYFVKIFQLFQTLAPRDRVESSGVGLALVKKIVEMYGGCVWVESIVGEGCTFFFTLPVTFAAPISTKENRA